MPLEYVFQLTWKFPMQMKMEMKEDALLLKVTVVSNLRDEDNNVQQ